MKCGNCKDDHQTAAMVLLCYKRSGKIGQPASDAQRAKPGEPDFQNSRGRREGDRRDLFRQIKALGARIEEGHYAIYNGKRAANDISFYEIVKPGDGQWAGRTFVNRKLSDESQKLSLEEQVRVLTLIVADPQGAATLFGSKVGKCPRCHRMLTNQKSRDRGIGPECAKAWGWSDIAA
jgi:hypothetical protein